MVHMNINLLRNKIYFIIPIEIYVRDINIKNKESTGFKQEMKEF